MKSFILGAGTAVAITALTFALLQWGSVSTAERYTVPTVHLTHDPSFDDHIN